MLELMCQNHKLLIEFLKIQYHPIGNKLPMSKRKEKQQTKLGKMFFEMS